MTLRRILTLLLLIPAVAALQSCIRESGDTADETTLVAVGDRAPDFTVTMTDGSSITLSDMRDRIVLLSFLSIDCPMCREEMGAVQKAVIERIAGKEIYYLPVVRDGGHDAVEEFCRQNGCTFAVGLDPDRSIYTLYATSFVPRSFIIDRNGIIRASYVEYGVEVLEEIVTTAESLL